jgi:hypothetical protein
MGRSAGPVEQLTERARDRGACAILPRITIKRRIVGKHLLIGEAHSLTSLAIYLLGLGNLCKSHLPVIVI